ncbi:hypothetical protein D9V35_03360 [Commensalibacter melissae]|nr:hypothetical protein D9V35_03360 [Commensalibacter melissae]
MYSYKTAFYFLNFYVGKYCLKKSKSKSKKSYFMKDISISILVFHLYLNKLNTQAILAKIEFFTAIILFSFQNLF